MHNWSVCGIKKVSSVVPNLDAFLCFRDTGFYFAVQGMANVSSFDIVCFEERVYFSELLNIQVQYLQCWVSSSSLCELVASSVHKPVVGTFSGLTLQSPPLTSCHVYTPTPYPAAFYLQVVLVQMYQGKLKKAAFKLKTPQMFVVRRNPPDTTQCKTLLILMTAHRLLTII